MKRKRTLALIIAALMTLCLLPVTALAANFTNYSGTYDESEYDQLKDFFNTVSADPDYTNGQEVTGSVYSDTEPNNWHGVEWMDVDEDGVIVKHVKSIDWLTGSFTPSTYSLNGDMDLSDFPYLTTLRMDYSQIDSLKVTNDTALTTLQCTRTKMTDADGNVTHAGITALDLSTNTALETVNCSKNSISSSLNTAAAGTHLTALNCSDNQITSLNLTQNTSLTNLDCSKNKLTALDVSHNSSLNTLSFFENEVTGTFYLTDFSSLHTLICYDNNLTGLVVEGCSGLSNISCMENAITDLDVRDCAGLTILTCSKNQLTALNTNGLKSLSVLSCSNNKLAALDVTTNTALTSLICASNQLTSLDVSKNILLGNLECNNNQLTSLDVNLLTALVTLYCGSNQIETLSAANATALTTLDCPANKLTALDVSHNTKLQILRCYDNALGALDLSKNTALTELDCTNCGLSTLDLSHNTALSYLYCGSNCFGTSGLNLSGNSGLGLLDCSSNGLTSLDLTYNTGLMMLFCGHNQLTALDFSHTPHIVVLDCSANKLTDFNYGSLVFYILDCTDNPLSHLKATVIYDFPESSNVVELTSDGEGYVGLYANIVLEGYKVRETEYPTAFYAQASPKTNAALINWTDAADTVAGTTSKLDLTAGTAYNLTAHFMALASSDADGRIYTGGRVTLTPSVTGGTWTFDSAYFSRKGNTFTALKEGASAITYTVNGAKIPYQVTIISSGLPATGQDFTWFWLCGGGALAALATAFIFEGRRRAQKA